MYLSVDIGGTKTLIALFSKRGRIVRRVKFWTANKFDEFLKSLLTELGGFTSYDIHAVVVAVPGVVQKNCSAILGNRAEWGEIDLLTSIKDLFSCPIYFENDANLAALYECSFYSGKAIFLTFSTGIGGGIVKDGKILPESAKFEPGHRIYEYGGTKLEWEDIAAASALEKAYGVRLATDLRGKTAMQDVAARVTLGLRDVVKEYSPEVVVLGGPLGKIFKRYAKYLPKMDTKFVQPKRPLESVVYGGFLYAKQRAK